MSHQAGVVKASRLLGLRADHVHVVEFGDGSSLRADARILDLGAPNGMLVFTLWRDLEPYEDRLVGMGYGYSCFGPPAPNETFDLASYKAMFQDWGWSGDANKKPDWL